MPARGRVPTLDAWCSRSAVRSTCIARQPTSSCARVQKYKWWGLHFCASLASKRDEAQQITRRRLEHRASCRRPR